jgi:hypothetical protein
VGGGQQGGEPGQVVRRRPGAHRVDQLPQVPDRGQDGGEVAVRGAEAGLAQPVGEETGQVEPVDAAAGVVAPRHRVGQVEGGVPTA